MEKNSPSGRTASTSSSDAVAGSTCTSQPRSAIRAGVIVLMPRSTAATVNRFSPLAGTTYVSAVDTSPASSAPAISDDASTRSSNRSGSASVVEIPTRIAPRSRRWRVRARVSTPEMPTTPWARSSSSSERRERQLDGTRAGSRTTYPATQICRDSGSSSLTPVLPMCGAVITTTWRWYDGSVSVSW